MSSVAPLVATIRDALRDAADVDRAPGMQAYMKSSVPYRGVPRPAVRTITGAAARAHPPLTLDDLQTAVRTLWDGADFREEQYAACELLSLPLATGRLELVPLYEHLATTGAWWDPTGASSRRPAGRIRPPRAARPARHRS
ncbi:MAG: alkylation repair protein [Aeromicrobium sp.]|jgi:3-methyladenine DNA glycosylase AlkD|nr:alkylation repair protein [Aeromicrobium sp.]